LAMLPIMVRVHGQKADLAGGGLIAVVGRVIGFIFVAGIALGIVAAVVLLPAWREREHALTQRDALAAKVWQYDRLIEYKQRLAEVTRCDPVQTQRLLISQQNYHQPGEVVVQISDAPIDPPAAVLLAARAPKVSEPSAILSRMAGRVERPLARTVLLLVAAAMMGGALMMFDRPAARETN